MTGLERRMAKLFGNEGKLFLAAFDHPQIYGVTEGLEDTANLVKELKDSKVDGFILNPGMFRHIPSEYMDNKLFVVRASVGGTMVGSGFSPVHRHIISGKEAALLDADAALVMFSIGGDKDLESQVELAQVVEDFHNYGIPVIAEVLAVDWTKNNDTDLISCGARIAAEIGADAIKAFYCTGFDKVTSNCPVPVILAGGPKEADICSVVKEVTSKGGKGLAFGRNIFQSPDPKETIELLNEALR